MYPFIHSFICSCIRVSIPWCSLMCCYFNRLIFLFFTHVWLLYYIPCWISIPFITNPFTFTHINLLLRLSFSFFRVSSTVFSSFWTSVVSTKIHKLPFHTPLAILNQRLAFLPTNQEKLRRKKMELCLRPVMLEILAHPSLQTIPLRINT